MAAASADERLSRAHLVVLLAVIVVFRLLVLDLIQSRDDQIGGDYYQYEYAAVSLIERGELMQVVFPVVTNCEDLVMEPGEPREEPIVDFAPGYPLAVAAVFKVFGKGVAGRKGILYTFTVLNGILLPLCMLFLFRTLGGRGRAWEAAVVLAGGLWPDLISLADHLLSENLTIPLLALWFVGFTSIYRAPSAPKALATAAVGTALFLTRVEFLPTLGVSIVLLGLRPWLPVVGGVEVPRGKHLGVALAYAVAMGGGLCSLAARNWIQFQEFLPTTIAPGRGLWIGVIDPPGGHYGITPEHPDRVEVVQECWHSRQPVKRMRCFRKHAWRLLGEDPWAYLAKTPGRLYRTNLQNLTVSTGSVWKRPVPQRYFYLFGRVLKKVAPFVLLPLFLIGLVACARHDWVLTGLVAFQWSTKNLVLHGLMLGYPRYGLTLIVVMLPVAMRGLELVAGWVRGRSASGEPASTPDAVV